jgi:hypothetical protein
VCRFVSDRLRTSRRLYRKFYNVRERKRERKTEKKRKERDNNAGNLILNTPFANIQRSCRK